MGKVPHDLPIWVQNCLSCEIRAHGEGKGSEGEGVMIPVDK
jgi:hypothetical protein